MTVKDRPADPIVVPQPKSIVVQFWDPGCDPNTPTAELEATFKQTHEGPNGYHEYGVAIPDHHIEIHVPLDLGLKRHALLHLALSLGHEPLSEAIQPGDVYLAAWEDHSYVLTCKEIRHNLVISEREQYVIALSDCVKIKRPDHVKK